MARHGGRNGGTATLAPPAEDAPADAYSDAETDADWDHIALWRCECGYVNAGSQRCSACGVRHPDAPSKAGRGSPPVLTDAPWAGDALQGRPQRAQGAGARAGRTVAGIVALNIAQQAIVVAVAIGRHMDTGPAIRLSLVSGVVYYTVCAFWALGRSTVLGVRPVAGTGHPLAGLAEGAVVGGGLAILLVAGSRLATGHPVLDPIAALLTSSGTAAFVVGAVLLVILGPLVEEIVFRGFLAEALRPRGRWAALLVSAAAFSVAHLRFAQFRYYVGMGLVLGGVYWRRGLVGSVAAHACFNGMLVVAAVAASHGPPVVLSGGGASITVPAAWQSVTPPRGALLSAIGPAGARIDLGRVDLGQVVEPQKLADDLGRGELAVPAGIRLERLSISIVDLPAGRAVMMRATVQGHEGRVLMLTKGTLVWIATVETQGSNRAATDFQHALSTLRLP